MITKKIKMVLFDIDGVITDGKKYIDGNGMELKSVSLKDLDAFKLLKDAGYKIGCITGEDTLFSRQFAKNDLFDYARTGCKEKGRALEEAGERYGIKLHEICYLGDGKYDIPALEKAGLGACPKDAVSEVKNAAEIVLEKKGGEGCIAELYSKLLRMEKVQMEREHVFIIAEIGINHNGDLEIAKKLIDWAVLSGCDAVKFQKRTIDKVYTEEYLNSYRESPWGTTQRAQKEGLEFGRVEYDEIDEYCREKNIVWFASAWDMEAQRFLRQYELKYNKIASAMLTDEEFLYAVSSEGKYTFISTGMSTYEEIDFAVDIFRKQKCPFELMHCNSTYPMLKEEANLRVIPALRDRYGCRVGYSGHETGRIVSTAAVALGATSMERHITLDPTMYGSDQAASLHVKDMMRLVEDIRVLETVLGNGKKVLTKNELSTRKKLRGY